MNGTTTIVRGGKVAVIRSLISQYEKRRFWAAEFHRNRDAFFRSGSEMAFIESDDQGFEEAAKCADLALSEFVKRFEYDETQEEPKE